MTDKSEINHTFMSSTELFRSFKGMILDACVQSLSELSLTNDGLGNVHVGSIKESPEGFEIRDDFESGVHSTVKQLADGFDVKIGLGTCANLNFNVKITDLNHQTDEMLKLLAGFQSMLAIQSGRCHEKIAPVPIPLRPVALPVANPLPTGTGVTPGEPPTTDPIMNPHLPKRLPESNDSPIDPPYEWG